jgi:protein required for attachment to host cells
MSSVSDVTWVVATDTNFCRIYSYHKKPERMVVLKEFNHPENRLKDTDLTSDKQGRYGTGKTVHGVYAPHADPKKVKIDDFSREISKELEQGRADNAYVKLIIVTSPHMDGLLLQHLNKHVKDLITHNIKNNVVHMNEKELLDFLHKHL